MAVSKRLRYEVLRRDNHACRYCGAKAPDVKLVIDHVVPDTLGGKDEPSNLVTACEPCNSGKSSATPDAALVADVEQDALRWARAAEIAAQRHRYERWERDEFRAQFEEHWNGWTYGNGKAFPLPTEWVASIDSMRDSGLDEGDLADAVRTAMCRTGVDDRFRYFCGVAWNVVRARREMAARIVARWDGRIAPARADPEMGLGPHAVVALKEALDNATEPSELTRWEVAARNDARDRDEEFLDEVPVAATAAAAISALAHDRWCLRNALQRLVERFPPELVRAGQAQARDDYQRNIPDGDYTEVDFETYTAYCIGEAWSLGAEVPV